MAVSIQRVMEAVEGIAPRSWAEDWDNVGLQVGNPADKVRSIGVALTPDAATIGAALTQGVELLITHHPLIFKGIRSIPTGNGGGLETTGRLIRECLVHGLTVYSAHTNLDIAPGGINDSLADVLDLETEKDDGLPCPMRVHHRESLYKLAAYVPMTHLEAVRDALWKAGAGSLGDYTDCSFHGLGTGTFKPGGGARPFLGSSGTLEKVEEGKLEVLVTEGSLKRVVSALKAAHPYEVAAYDLLKLENPGRGYGLGRYCRLMEPVPLREYARSVRDRLGCDSVRIVGEHGMMVKRVAVCGGAGSELIPIIRRFADVLVTGDVKYHEALLALEHGVAVIDAGHHHTEMPGMRRLAALLDGLLDEPGVSVRVVEGDGGPFSIL